MNMKPDIELHCQLFDRQRHLQKNKQKKNTSVATCVMQSRLKVWTTPTSPFRPFTLISYAFTLNALGSSGHGQHRRRRSYWTRSDNINFQWSMVSAMFARLAQWSRRSRRRDRKIFFSFQISCLSSSSCDKSLSIEKLHRRPSRIIQLLLTFRVQSVIRCSGSRFICSTSLLPSVHSSFMLTNRAGGWTDAGWLPDGSI